MFVDSIEFYAQYQPAYWVLTFFVFAIGACYGSFMNVCIWRMPRNEEVVTTPSHCPHCDKAIAWYHNIPVFSWVVLGARCRWCRGMISPRYVIVEIIVGLLFVGIWHQTWWEQWPVETLIPHFFLVGSLVAIALIDCEHYIIPDQFTLSGMGLGLLTAALIPVVHLPGDISGDLYRLVQEDALLFTFVELISKPFPQIYQSPRAVALLNAFLGIIFGGGFLWLIAEFGYVLLGRTRQRREQPVRLTMTEEGMREEGKELESWEDVFGRPGAKLRLTGEVAMLVNEDGSEPEFPQGEQTIVVSEHRVEIGDWSTPSEGVAKLEIDSREWVLPREVMGMGDVKLMAAIGALLGPTVAITILLFSSVLGTAGGVFFGAMQMFLDRERWHNKLPYGAYIAAATLLTLFFADTFVAFLVARRMGTIS